ncbi:nuclear transport factor 2 family protein [Herbiconiux sp. P16]|uniref:nuclear transport factor 2 family protein n=1 Tax=Herbiconiux wuyangfengii TaxID=3342794 RepID=UPI0035BA2413
MTNTNAQIDPKDEADIRALLVDYVIANDGRAWEKFADIFTETGTLGNQFASYLPGAEAFNGVMPGAGGEAVGTNVGALMRPLDATQHFLGATWFEPTDEGITVRTQVIAHHHRAGRYYHSGGTYVDNFVRTDKGWRIRTRVLETIWTIGDVTVVTGD